MKIAHIITSLDIGGAEKLMVDILPRMQSLGHDVELVLFDGTPTIFKQQLLDNGIKITDLGCGGSVYNPKFIFKLRGYFERFDIVHTHNTSPQYFAAVAKMLSIGRAKLVTTEHNTYNRRRDIWWFKAIDKLIYKQYNAIIAISKKAEENLVKYLGLSKHITTIENGVDIGRYMDAQPLEREDELNISEDVVLITQVAGFRVQKDQDCVIRSLRYLPANVHLAFVGDGERREACEELTAELGFSDRVHFLGLRGDIPNILKSSDIVVMSSHWEGFGLAAVEGMAAGKPTISSRVQGLTEVTEGAGLLFEHSNEQELAEHIVKLINDEEFYNDIASKCIARSKQYDISIMVDRYLAEYSLVIKK